MSLLVTFNGTQYLVPTINETGWDTVVTNFLADLGAHALIASALTPYAPLASPTFTGTATLPAIAGALTLSSGLLTCGKGAAISGAASTIDQATIGATTPAAGTFTALTATSGNVFNTIGRNKLHNPLFNIAQRGAGPFTVSAAYSMDRWCLSFQTDTVSVTRATLVDADRTALGDEEAQFALQNVFTGNAGAGAFNRVYQPVENVRRLAGKTVTISLWAKAASGTPKLGISANQFFGTGGSPSATVSGNGTAITLSTTWTRYSVTLAIPTIVGKTLGTDGNDSTAIHLWFSSGATNATYAGSVGVQSGTVTLWGGQLEIGSVMTALEKPDQRYDLANCQRFFQTMHVDIWGYGAAGNGFAQRLNFPVTMRATPTTGGILAGSTNNASGQAIDSLTNDGFRATAVITGTGGAYWTGAQEYFSADL